VSVALRGAVNGPARAAMTNVVRSALPDYKRQKRLARCGDMRAVSLALGRRGAEESWHLTWIDLES
jgi:hypothetical protein